MDRTRTAAQSVERPPLGSGPESTAAVVAEGPSGPRAGFLRRLAASLIDGAVLILAYVGLALLLQQGLIVLLVLNFLVDMVYYALLEGSARGQTLGKMVLAIRVIDADTALRIGFGRAALRFLARYLSYIPFGLGYLWMLQDREKQTWHDKLTRTVVVPVSDYPVAGPARVPGPPAP
jgi:uncharacterized RDD family membrane protein YckC